MEKQELIETFAFVYKADNYPPIAGKVLGLFLISDQKHFTFEDIMTGINASKSATSKALKFLINLDEVNFVFSENSKRKRLFYFNSKSTLKRLEKIIHAHTVETGLLKEVLENRNEENEEMNDLIKKTIAFNEDILDFITKKVTKHFKTENKN